MNRVIQLVGMVLTLGLPVMLLPAVAEERPVKEAPGNLVKNFSFEEMGEGDAPAGWKGSSSEPDRPKGICATNEVYSGKRSLQLSEKSALMTQAIPLQAGRKYKVSFQAKGKDLQRDPNADGQACVVAINYKDKEGKEKPIHIEPVIGNEWKNTTKLITIPEGAGEEGNITLILYGATGTLWYDDVVVVKLEE